MSPRRVGILLAKELVHGAKSFFFVFAVLVPFVMSLLLSLVFGNLFTDTPKLGIADGDGSLLVGLAERLDSVVVATYSSSAALQDAVRAGAVDLGIALPAGFDDAVVHGDMPKVDAYIWGESLAKNRAILEATVAHLVQELAGQEAPVEIVVITLGEGENVPWDERLLPFIVLMAVVMGGSMVPAASLVDEKQNRTLTALTITPARLEEVFLSKGLVGILVSVMVAVLILALNQSLGGKSSLLVLVLVLSSIVAAEFGVLLGALTNDITSLFAAVKAVGLFLYAPALLYFFPQIPDWIGRIFPTYYIIQPVVEVTQRGGTFSDVALEILILAGLAVVLAGAVVVVTRKVKRQEV
jgi:ABC-2 type transport system permease protein